MIQISIINLQRKVPIPVSKIKSGARKAAHMVKLNNAELSIVCIGPQRMRRVNREYLGHDYVTDVITFDHGEIIICPAVAVRNAKLYRSTLQKELLLYAVHGILHLAGYDDHAPADIRVMRAQEQKILEQFQ